VINVGDPGDGVTDDILVITGRSNDSGPLSRPYAAGARLEVGVPRGAEKCKDYPYHANVVVQYKSN
jgi:hypothetical protein